MRLRLRPAGGTQDPATALGAGFSRLAAKRRAEADAFYSELTSSPASTDEAAVMRQAFAGMLWSKQFYHYDVARWLDGDPAQPPPPAEQHRSRNARWRGFEAFDVMSMPDTWEYPWFAAWDMTFHCGSTDPDLLPDGTPSFDDDFLIFVNAGWATLEFQIPLDVSARPWEFVCDTFDPTRGGAAAGAVSVGPRSLVVLRSQT